MKFFFKNTEETKEEIHNLKLRNLESYASVEAANEMNVKKSFSDRSSARITAPLCPTLSKQLASIRSYKQYVTDSIHDLDLIIQQKVNSIYTMPYLSLAFRLTFCLVP